MTSCTSGGALINDFTVTRGGPIDSIHNIPVSFESPHYRDHDIGGKREVTQRGMKFRRTLVTSLNKITRSKSLPLSAVPRALDPSTPTG
jgi:hypothetical protein